MTTIVGNGRKYLLIDLCAEKWGVQQIPLTHYRQYPGGEGLGLSLWSYYAGDPSLVDPLGDNNPLCIAAGSLTGTEATCSNWLSIVSKSPLTKLMALASGPVSFGRTMKKAGWDAIILLGSARRPMILHISVTDVKFITSEKLIDLQCSDTLETLNPGPHEQVLLIGPAGEHLVPYASIISEGLPVGRGGLGAVLGSKRIKAVIVEEDEIEIRPVNSGMFESGETEFKKRLSKSDSLASVEKAGTLYRVHHAISKGFAAIQNFSKRTDPRLYHVNPEECIRKYAIEHAHCDDCRFDCKKTIHLPNGEFAALVDFEGCLALGPNLMNFDMAVITAWYQTILAVGLDPISTGNVLGWAMEAQAKKIIDWAPMLSFGKCDGIVQLIEHIAIRKGPGMYLALGVRELSKRFGGAEFAYHVQGLEMPPYDVRGAWGEGLTQGVGNPQPFIPEIIIPKLEKIRLKAKVKWVYYQEELDAITRTLGLCPFAVAVSLFGYGRKGLMRNRVLARMLLNISWLGKKVVSPTILARMYHGITGYEITSQDVLRLGRKIVNLRHRLDTEMKGEILPAVIPLHFLIEPESNHREAVVVPYRTMQLRYRAIASRCMEVPTSLSEPL